MGLDCLKCDCPITQTRPGLGFNVFGLAFSAPPVCSKQVSAAPRAPRGGRLRQAIYANNIYKTVKTRFSSGGDLGWPLEGYLWPYGDAFLKWRVGAYAPTVANTLGPTTGRGASGLGFKIRIQAPDELRSATNHLSSAPGNLVHALST